MEGGLAQGRRRCPRRSRRPRCPPRDRGKRRSMRGTGQMWIQGNVADTVGWQRHGATVVQGAGGIIIPPELRDVEIDNGVVQRAARRPDRVAAQRALFQGASTARCRSSSQRAIVQRAARHPVAAEATVVQGATTARQPHRRPSCRSTCSCSACRMTPP